MEQSVSAKKQSKRWRVVRAGARWMDRHYPDWSMGVRNAVKSSQFDIECPSLCVIGAGTGHRWTREENNKMCRWVARSLRVSREHTNGLTSSPVYEPLWIAAAFQRGRHA